MAPTSAKQGTTSEQRRAYLASLPPETRKGLLGLRKFLRMAAPGATEGFSYGMPSFLHEGRPLVWYAVWKRHYGLYPISAKLMAPYATELGEYEISKGTIRFPIAHPPTPAIVQRIVDARLAELQAHPK